MSKEQAVKEGAIAFFGEKYGDDVRVVTIGGFSKELCGGTHLHSTGEIEVFKIVSESSIQAGVRRIEAVTGRAAKEFVDRQKTDLQRMAGEFGANTTDLVAIKESIARAKEKVSALAARAESPVLKSMRLGFADALIQTKDGLIILEYKRATPELYQKTLSAYQKSSEKPFAFLGMTEDEEKITFVVASSEGLTKKGFQSGAIVKEIAAIVDGKGGGRPDFAVGGGKNVAKKSEAVALGAKLMREKMRP